MRALHFAEFNALWELQSTSGDASQVAPALWAPSEAAGFRCVHSGETFTPLGAGFYGFSG